MKLDDLTDSPLPVLAPRADEGHKGDYGRALLVGGSRGMSGAIAMAGIATLRGGAGLVTLAVPQAIQNVVSTFSPCYMTHALADEHGHISAAAIAELTALSTNATALALGPGLARSAELTDFVQQLYRTAEKSMVVDADALFALAEAPAALTSPAAARILTPHPGEFARLMGDIPANAARPAAAAKLAQRDDSGHTIVVLKGHHTVVTDGRRFVLNQTGNPGMATGGSGDVLTGIITALLCQSLAPFDAARLAVHIHGLAGDLAALELGQVSLIATDLIDYLPQAFQTVGT
jgi:NAD(P)H-hydrate epimerase